MPNKKPSLIQGRPVLRKSSAIDQFRYNLIVPKERKDTRVAVEYAVPEDGSGDLFPVTQEVASGVARLERGGHIALADGKRLGVFVPGGTEAQLFRRSSEGNEGLAILGFKAGDLPAVNRSFPAVCGYRPVINIRQGDKGIRTGLGSL